MEEILASIRRIISEDDAPAAPEPAHAHAHGDDVLELTQKVEPEPARAAEPPRAEPASIPSLGELGDLDVSERAPPPAPKAAAPPPPPPPEPHAEEPLVSPQAAQSAASHFGQLAQSVAMPAAGRSLEDLVREMLRPMLKDWLDQNLAPIVQARVQAEVERVSRGRGY